MREVKVKYYLFFLGVWTSYYFVIESIGAFYFVNNVVAYKALLVKEKGGMVVYKIFIVNVGSMHFSATWQFWPFQRPWMRSPGGLMDSATVGRRRGGLKCEDTIYTLWLIYWFFLHANIKNEFLLRIYYKCVKNCSNERVHVGFRHAIESMLKTF